VKYYIRLECLFEDEPLLEVEGGFGYDSGNKDESKIAIFKNLEDAKEQCEMSDEYIVDEKGIIHYFGEECSDCMRNLKHPDDIVDDCNSCNNSGIIKNNKGA